MRSYERMKAITTGVEVGSIVLVSQILNVSVNDTPLDKLTVALGIGLYVGAKAYEHIYTRNVLNSLGAPGAKEDGLEKRVGPSPV